MEEKEKKEKILHMRESIGYGPLRVAAQKENNQSSKGNMWSAITIALLLGSGPEEVNDLCFHT